MDHEQIGAADGGPIDWDAAFDAIVAPLRTPRHRRIARLQSESQVISVFLREARWRVNGHDPALRDNRHGIG